MNPEVSILLVKGGLEPLGAVKSVLLASSAGAHVQFHEAHSCDEACRSIGHHRPAVVLSDARLCDGTWLDVLRVCHAVDASMKVIVLAPFIDTHEYLDAMEAGAFDLMTAPFAKSDLLYVLGQATGSSLFKPAGGFKVDAGRDGTSSVVAANGGKHSRPLHDRRPCEL